MQNHTHATANAAARALFAPAAAELLATIEHTEIAVTLARLGLPREYLVITRAAQSPAATGVPGWAAELVAEAAGQFIDLVARESAAASLPFVQVDFGAAGRVKVRARQPGGANLAAAFRAEGAPVRVGRLSLGGATLTPKSMGVIATFTEEELRASAPSIEQVCREAITVDTAQILDALMFDDTAASAIRPAGLQTYATGANSAVASGSTIDAIVADFAAMAARLYGAGFGTRPHWVLHQARLTQLAAAAAAASSSLITTGPAGLLILGLPAAVSLDVPADVVFLIDTASIALGIDTPRLKVVQEASVHEEDTNPLPIASTGSPNTVAAPVRSLYQTASLALRGIVPVDWQALGAAPGFVQTLDVATWPAALQAAPEPESAPAVKTTARRAVAA